MAQPDEQEAWLSEMLDELGVREALDELANDPDAVGKHWDHCDLGGHPSQQSMMLLPDHKGIPAEILWTDLAMHLVAAWRLTLRAAERANGGPLPSERDVGNQVQPAIDLWHDVDGFAAAMFDLQRIRRDEA